MEARRLMVQRTTTRDIVAKLWNLCHILRDDGVTYNDYVTELTFLLFVKMMAETGREDVSPEFQRDMLESLGRGTEHATAGLRGACDRDLVESRMSGHPRAEPVAARDDIENARRHQSPPREAR
jgi:type I restriction-modification system DNA methylase subunit